MVTQADRDFAARLIYRVRTALDLSCDGLARFLGTTRETVARWERATSGRPDQLTRTVLQACLGAIEKGDEIELRRAMDDPDWLCRLSSVFRLGGRQVCMAQAAQSMAARAEENSPKVEESLLASLPPLRRVGVGASNGTIFDGVDDRVADDERDPDGSDEFDEGPH